MELKGQKKSAPQIVGAAPIPLQPVDHSAQDYPISYRSFQENEINKPTKAENVTNFSRAMHLFRLSSSLEEAQKSKIGEEAQRPARPFSFGCQLAKRSKASSHCAEDR